MTPERAREPGKEGPRRGWTVRQRLLVLMICLMALGLTLTGGTSFFVQYDQVADKVDADLVQEVSELQRLARAGPATDGEPFTDVASLFRAFIATAVAGEDEAFLAFIDAEPVYVSAGDRPFEIAHPDVITTIEESLPEPGEARITSVRTQGTELRLIVADVQLPEETRGASFVVGNDIGRQISEVNRRLLTFVLISLGSLAIAAALGYLLLGRLLRPLRDLREATSHISSDDLTRRVDVATAGDTDVAELAVRFNQMLDRIEGGVRDQRQFLDDAAHELRTPLTILRGNAELLHPEDPREVEATRELMLDEVDRMQRLVDDLLVLARAQRPDFVRPTPIDLTELAVECMERVTSLGDREWSLVADAEGTVLLDRQRVIQAVVQLAANAVKFSDEGSAIELAVKWIEPDSDEAARARAARPRSVTGEEDGEDPGDRRLVGLSVSDHGTGIAESQLARIFARFGRGDNAANVEGSGLGLAIVQAIAEAHGGSAGVESVAGLGSRFTIWLPTEDVQQPDGTPARTK